MSIREYLETTFINYRGIEQLVARRAHNPKVAGSSPAPATIIRLECNPASFPLFGKMQGFPYWLMGEQELGCQVAK